LKNDMGNPPRLIFWETTAACNLECVHCRRTSAIGGGGARELSTEEAARFIESLARDFEDSPVLVLSGGEPLLRADLFEWVRFARGKNIRLALATNGTLVDNDMASEIVRSGIGRVSISFDGAGPETHDRFRNMPGSFEKAVRGFKNLKNLGMPMQVNATVSRHNVHEVEKIFEMALGLGAESLHYFLLVPVGCGAEIKVSHQLSPSEYEETLTCVHRLSRRGTMHVRPICAPHYFRILAGERNAFPGQSGRGPFLSMTKGCLAGTGIVFVSHTGEVFPCGYLPLSCGNVREGALKDIWENSEILRKLRGEEFLEGKCGACEYRTVCSGCRARAYQDSGNFLAEEPNCVYSPRGAG